jgi:mRNA-degrading endonuclease HigB of HigAB toxin-antitoxin module
LFNPKKYIEIKKEYEINSENIEAILYGYRYSLNELLSNEDDDDVNHDYIYSSIYNIGKSSYLSEKYYPGTDTKEEPYYEIYSKIKNHFKEKPNDGCYVCMCKKGYYHSVASGFPGISEKGMICPSCNKEIGIISKKVKFENNSHLKLKIVKRDNYFRIFKDEDEIDSLKFNKCKKEKLNEIKYMTLKEFEERYINPLYIKEKGLPQITKDNFFKDNKIIRNLSQISYRLLNYILYSHLFFASLLTNSKKYDKLM